MSSETPSASQSLPSSGYVVMQTTREEKDESSRVQRQYMSQTQTGSNTETIRKFFINPAVSEANMVDTCKHFEIGSGSVRSLSHLSVFVIEHLCRAEGATNTKQIK